MEACASPGASVCLSAKRSRQCPPKGEGWGGEAWEGVGSAGPPAQGPGVAPLQGTHPAP